jgi:cyclic di-GMP phosphodiesterase Gmr
MFGDQLLQAVALAILSCLDEGQTLARLGGDEFIVLATDSSQSALEAMASRYHPSAPALPDWPYRDLHRLFAGDFLAPQHGNDRESIIRNADTAMYIAKENGRGKFCVFTPR